MEYTGLSKRGEELEPKELNPLLNYLNEYNKDPYNAESNPRGIIDCGVAENDVIDFNSCCQSCFFFYDTECQK